MTELELLELSAEAYGVEIDFRKSYKPIGTMTKIWGANNGTQSMMIGKHSV